MGDKAPTNQAMNLHHVGIICPDVTLIDLLGALAGAGDELSRNIEFRHVPEFQCDCYLVGKVELVVPNGPRKEGTPLHRWLLSRGRSIHHIAFEVTDLDAMTFLAFGVGLMLRASTG